MSYFLAVGEIEGYSEAEVKSWFASNFRDDKVPYGEEDPDITAELEDYDVIVAYLWYPDYAGNASILARHKETGEYYYCSGSHCSCYGFEDQWGIVKVAESWIREAFDPTCYDDDTDNAKIIKEHITKVLGS